MHLLAACVSTVNCMYGCIRQLHALRVPMPTPSGAFALANVPRAMKAELSGFIVAICPFAAACSVVCDGTRLKAAPRHDDPDLADHGAESETPAGPNLAGDREHQARPYCERSPGRWRYRGRLGTSDAPQSAHGSSPTTRPLKKSRLEILSVPAPERGPVPLLEATTSWSLFTRYAPHPCRSACGERGQVPARGRGRKTGSAGVTHRSPQRGNPSVLHPIARTRPISACEALCVNEVFSKRIIELEPGAQSLLNAQMPTPPYLAFHSPEHLDRLTAGSRFVVPGGADCCGRCLAYRLRL